MPNPSEITIKDLCAETGLTKNHIAMLIKRGKLPEGRKDGKYRYLPRVESLLLLAAHKQETAPAVDWSKLL